jgi:hypothetical protein
MGASFKERVAAGSRLARTFGVAAAVAIGASAGLGVAQEPAPEAPKQEEEKKLTTAELAEVEEAFWLCDYVSTNVGVRATPMRTCLMVTEALKDEKFDGDFNAFVAWWNENKTVEHERLEKKYTAEAEKLRSGTTA